MLSDFDAICDKGWEQRGITALEIREFCAWRGAPMFFVSCRGELLDAYQPPVKENRAVAFTCYQAHAYFYKSARAVSHCDDAPRNEGLYRGERKASTVPPFSEWRPWAGGVESGHFWAEDLRSVRAALLAQSHQPKLTMRSLCDWRALRPRVRDAVADPVGIALRQLADQRRRARALHVGLVDAAAHAALHASGAGGLQERLGPVTLQAEGLKHLGLALQGLGAYVELHRDDRQALCRKLPCLGRLETGQATWADFKWSLDATAHVEPRCLAQALEAMEDAWPEGEEHMAKLSVNALGPEPGPGLLHAHQQPRAGRAGLPVAPDLHGRRRQGALGPHLRDGALQQLHAAAPPRLWPSRRSGSRRATSSP